MKIILSITMIMILSSYTAAKMADERCGSQAKGRTCNDYRCCSHSGYCGTQEEYCSPKKQCQSNCWSGPGLSNISAYYYPYDARKHNYDMNVVKTECSKYDADKPYSWRSIYGWTAFCGPAGPRGKEACFKCLKVTNPSVNNVVVKLRIVDECADGGLNIDNELFNRLDTDGAGFQRGHLNVDYQFISCDDKLHTEKPDFKNILVSAVDNV